FYLDEASLHDTTKNVRGGNPVLFPSPGKLDGDCWTYVGPARKSVTFAMKQHGFARNLPWEIASRATLGRAAATLRLRSSDETKAQFPWDFVAEYTYALAGGTLRVDLAITNAG